MDRLASHPSFVLPEGLKTEDWIRATVKGADDRSEKWKHILVLAGLLNGAKAVPNHGLREKLKQSLGHATVAVGNLVLRDTTMNKAEGMVDYVMALALGNCFDLLTESERWQIDVGKLLPVLIQAMYFSTEGLWHGYFLGILDPDIVQVGKNSFNWSSKSATFFQTQLISSSPIVSSFGPLSRLAAFCLDITPDFSLLLKTTEALAAFSRSLCVQWRQSKLSEVDVAEESTFLAREALTITLPVLWQLLKAAMFSVVIMQSSLLGRILAGNGIPIVHGEFVVNGSKTAF